MYHNQYSFVCMSGPTGRQLSAMLVPQFRQFVYQVSDVSDVSFEIEK